LMLLVLLGQRIWLNVKRGGAKWRSGQRNWREIGH
jgi:hypothetical protein